MVGEKALIFLFTLLGALLALIGVIVAWMANSGLVSSSIYVVYGLIGFGIILVIIGLHLLLAGIASLKR